MTASHATAAPTGTLAWARETMGAMTARDRRGFIRQAISMQANMAGSLLFRRNRIAVDIDSIQAPDSALCKNAEQLCAQVSPVPLFNHCARAYVWGCIFARHAGITFDAELYYAACMLHDLGLTDAYRDCARHGECFTLDSVEGASALAKDAGWDVARQDALAEVILLHMNVVVGLQHGAEAHLLHESASLDCLGMRAWEITKDTRRAVVARHPRGEIKPLLLDVFGAEARRRPQCRSAFLIRYLLFRPLVRMAPF